jgi:Flp pilus assembly pilin Flp
MMDSFRTSLAGEEGQTLVEYAILLMLIVIITVAILTSTGTSLAGIIGHAGGAV